MTASLNTSNAASAAHQAQAQTALAGATAVAGATLKLCMERPYLSAAIWAMQRVPTDIVPTMAVDAAWRLYYNPETVLKWTGDETAGVLYHEVCHLLRDHAGRATNLPDGEAGRWNIACDAEINDGLATETDVTLPDGAIYPSVLGMPEGLLAEEYFQRIPAAKTGAAGPGCRCGSGATGRAEPWEAAAGSKSAGGVSSGEPALIRRMVALAIRESSRKGSARTRGTIPEHWERWAEKELTPPQVDWRRELAAAVRRSLADVMGASNYHYSRPSRRQSACPGIVLPSLRQPTPSVAVIVDTSGSVSSDMLSDALSEVQGILAAAGQREGVTVLSVDAAVHSCQRVFRAQQVRPGGGGGTDMGVGLAAAEKLRPRPEVVIVITDGFTPWPVVAPAGMRTVIALMDERGTTPDWARVVPLWQKGTS